MSLDIPPRNELIVANGDVNEGNKGNKGTEGNEEENRNNNEKSVLPVSSLQRRNFRNSLIVSKTPPHPLRFRVIGKGKNMPLHFVRGELKKLGFVEEKDEESDDWIFTWGMKYTREQFKALKGFQKVCILPGNVHLCRKDRLHDSVQEKKLTLNDENDNVKK